MEVLTLPDTVLRVESPLKWIEDMECEAVQKRKRLQKLLRSGSFEAAIFGKLHKLENVIQEENLFSYHLPTMNQHVVAPINLAAIHVYANNFEKALVFLKDAERVSNTSLVGDHKRVRKVMDYTIQVLRWSISVVQLGQHETSATTLSEHEAEITNFQQKWRKLMKDYKSKATVEYVKAKLKKMMGVPDDIVLENLITATQLDPEYFLWHQALYNCYREIRRKADGKDVIISISREEMLACTQSYKIRPTVMLNILTMASMIKEDLSIKSRTGTTKIHDDRNEWGDEENKSLDKCLNMLNEALEIATFHGYQSYVEEIKLEQAHALLHIKHNDKEKVTQGEQILLKECPEAFPNSSQVLNRLGIYYEVKAQEALSSARELAGKAQQSFKTAIEKDPSNFHLLKSYIQFLRFHPLALKKDYVQLLEMINKALEVQTIEEYQVKLEILRGCVIWIYNPENCRRLEENGVACEIWINLLKKYPDAMDKLLEYMKNPPFTIFSSWGRKLLTCVNHLDVVLELNKMRKALEMSRGNRDEETLQVIFNLWVMGEMNPPEAPPYPVEIEIAKKNLKKPSTGVYSIPQRNKKSTEQLENISTAWNPVSPGSATAADEDDNWRK